MRSSGGVLRSLTSRLVAAAVGLALLVSLILGTATTLVMQHSLTDRLDDEVEAALTRAIDGPPPPPGVTARPGPIDLRNQAPGTVIVAEAAGTTDASGTSEGVLLGEGRGEREEVDDAVLATVRDVARDGRARAAELPGLGGYRMAAVEVDEVVVAVGLPTEGVDAAVTQLVTAAVGLGAAAVLLAGGTAAVVVRRQLRPLRQVAATADRVASLPLESGEIELAERVPAPLTDERTEVGQVGAALNTLLAHVESSLSARHRSEQQVRQFVADASHELRTPLTTIAGYAELARRRPDDVAAQATALAKVTEESARMTSLVEDLLLLARLDAGRPLDRSPVDLTRLLLEAVSDARVVTPSHRWRLDLPEESVTVLGDEARLHQVVTNLLTNAARHTPAGTTVTVTARPGRVEVHDDGPGFPPDLLPRALERFARGDDSRSRFTGAASPQSTGLGLALVDAIVGAHGGTVGLSSRPGDTRVTLHLP